MEVTKHTLFVTGAAGYVGAMLCDHFSKRDDVEEIIALDFEDKPELLKNTPKLTWLTGNTSDESWQQQVRAKNPDIVIHAAWQIRSLYGKASTQWKWNIDGTDKVFDAAFSTPSVKKLIHFSTAAVYGAYTTNTIEHRFKEDEPLREETYRYAREKQETEKRLKNWYEETAHKPHVFILRPAAITGPRGRYMRDSFGLQSALAGRLKGGFVFRIVSLLLSYMPATPLWLRQFIHEDDVRGIVELLSFDVPAVGKYEAFNVTPPGEPVLAKDMADAVGKKVITIRPWMVQILCTIFWHLTRGKVPTSPGVWRAYSYPVALDGSKISDTYNYQYQYHSKDAITYTDGYYQEFIADADKKSKLVDDKGDHEG